MPVPPAPSSPSARPTGEAAAATLSTQARAVLAALRDDGASGDGASRDAASRHAATGVTDWAIEAIHLLSAELSHPPRPAPPAASDGPRR